MNEPGVTAEVLLLRWQRMNGVEENVTFGGLRLAFQIE